MKIIVFLILVLKLDGLSFGLSQEVPAPFWTKKNGERKLSNLLQMSSKYHSTSPRANPETDVLFYLYTRKENSAYQLTIGDSSKLSASSFNPSNPTKIAIHGYLKNYQTEAIQLIREAYLNNTDTDVNIIGVDWSLLAHPLYVWATHNTEAVGEQIGQMVDWLVSAGARIEDFHLIGHSLGAHVASFAANNITSGRITRITGLDPAYPLFGLPLRPASKRLDPSDADVVDCIHTCGGYMGFYEPLGTHDFYPNGGSDPQPGCSLDISGSCSHLRAVLLYSESVNSTFKAHKCSSMDKLKKEDCSDGEEALMGDPAVNWPGGLYFLKTNAKSPFAIENDSN